MYSLSRIIDGGNFHQNIIMNNDTVVELYPEIPKCFKIDLKDLESPLLLAIKYSKSTDYLAVDSPL